MAGDAVADLVSSDTRSTTAPAVSDGDLPANIYDNDSAAALLADNIEELLGMSAEDTEDEDQETEDQGTDQSEEDHSDDQGDDQSEDDEDEYLDDEDDDNAEESDQGDDQSADDSEVESASGLFTRGEDGKIKAASMDDVEITEIIDGEERTLTIAEMKNGYMRGDDYTRKTQQFALRVEEGIEEGLKEAHAKIDGRVIDLEVILKTFTGIATTEPDFSQLVARHGGNAEKAAAEYEQIKALRDKLDDAKKLVTEAKERETKSNNKRLGDIANRTIKVVKESKRVSTPKGDRPMNDREFRKLSNDMNQYMTDIGLTRDQIIGGVLQDPVYVQIVEDAVLGKAHRERKSAMKTKRRSTAKRTSQTSTGRPVRGSKGSKPDRARIRKQSKDTGSEEASLALIEGLLP